MRPISETLGKVLVFAIIAVMVWAGSSARKAPQRNEDCVRSTITERARVDSLRQEIVALNAAVEFGIEPELSRLILRVAREESISPRLAYRLVWMESRFDSLAISVKGAIGLTQVMPFTGLAFCSLQPEELFTAEANLRCGFRYLREQLATFGRVDLALLAYHAGPARIARGYRRNQWYADAIMEGL